MDCSLCCDIPEMDRVVITLKSRLLRYPELMGSIGLRDFLLPRGGINNLSASFSLNNETPFGPESNGTVDESFYAEDKKCVNLKPPYIPPELPAKDLICFYDYKQTLEFVGAASEYENNLTDPCYDWNVFDINVDYGNVESGYYFDYCQDGRTCHPVENVSDWSEQYNYECHPENDDQCHPYNIANFIPTSSENEPAKYPVGLRHVPIPDVTRIFSEAFFADLNWKNWSNESTVAETEPFPVASMIRDRRDGRITGLQTLVKFKFKPPPSCYVQIWSRIIIYNITMSDDPLTCTPNVKSETPHVEDMPVFIWEGDKDKDTCYSDEYLEFAYPFSFGGTVDDNGSGLITFKKLGSGADKNKPDEKAYEVQTGFGKEAYMQFKISYVKGYEPDWCQEGFYIPYIPDINEKDCNNPSYTRDGI